MKDSTRNILLIIAVIIISISIFKLQQLNKPATENISTEEIRATAAVNIEKSVNGMAYPKAPELAGITNWVNSEPLSIDGLKGKVVLVDFWTYSCINCIRTLPYLKEWWQKYEDEGFVLIGVHTPEFEFEKDAENVKKAT